EHVTAIDNKRVERIAFDDAHLHPPGSQACSLEDWACVVIEKIFNFGIANERQALRHRRRNVGAKHDCSQAHNARNPTRCSAPPDRPCQRFESKVRSCSTAHKLVPLDPDSTVVATAYTMIDWAGMRSSHRL